MLLRAGQLTLLIQGGEPVGVVKRLPEPIAADVAVRRLECLGLLRPAAKRGALGRWTPRPLKGAPLSLTLREGRHRV